MALLRWISEKLFGPAKRDVSRLEQENVDLVDETVDLSERPLKAEHHRRAKRDRRLLPKRKASGLNPYGKKTKLFSQEEADRLFSSSLRTQNRNIRDLLTDEEQLGRFRLPVWSNESELAQALQLSLSQLRHYGIHRNQDKVSHYLVFRALKADGRERVIMAPKRRLKEVQRKILKLVLEPLEASPQAHGFVKGRSVKTGAEPHVGKEVVIKLDLEDFFGSVTFARVRGLFLALGYGYPVAANLALLTTECPRQRVQMGDDIYRVPVGERYCVQGAPTSPAICNLVAKKLDRRLSGMARKLGFSYTRYADDLTFSGADKSKIKHLLGLVSKIVSDEGFRLNRAKTKVMRRGSRQQVTGVTVNDTLGLSRKARRRLRAELHQARKDEQIDPRRSAILQGKIAYLRMLNPAQADALESSQGESGESSGQ